MSAGNLKLASGGWRDAKFRKGRLFCYVGSFTTNGDAAAASPKGAGFSVHHHDTGLYLITLDRAWAEIVSIDVNLGQAAAGNDAAFYVPSTVTPGAGNTPASFDIQTQSADGTAADISGPVVNFRVWVSEKPTPATAIALTHV
jgi:hypothetical protein